MNKEYFEQRIITDKELPILPFRETPCEDCAVVWGFYTDISNALKEMPEAIQIAYSQKWFCHENPGMACRGNANNLGIT